MAVAVGAIALATIINAPGVIADPGGDNPPASPPPPPTTIVAEVGLPPTGSPGGDGNSSGGGSPTPAAPPPIPCSWNDVPTTQPTVEAINATFVFVANVLAPINGYFDTIALTFYERFGVLHRAGDAPGQWLKAQRADCSRATAPGGVSTGDRRWVDSVPPDPADFIDGTTRRVTEAVLPPAPAVNPPSPGYARLGMWLAVDDVGPYVARAQLPASGPAAVWAETTATLTSTTFSFDPGGSTTCAGAGTPIPESALDEVDEGPCGYTFTDYAGPTTLTITSEWTVTWRLSDGRSGTQPDPIILTTSLPYEVREIQTVGVPSP